MHNPTQNLLTAAILKFKCPTDNFTPSQQKILITDNREIPRGTSVVMLLAHKPLVISEEEIKMKILDPNNFYKFIQNDNNFGGKKQNFYSAPF